MDDPVAQKLLDTFKHTVSYDMYGMLVGNPEKPASPAQGVDPWGATYATDDEIIFAKHVQEKWLTPAEETHLNEWMKKTTWLERAAGKALDASERAAMLVNLGNALVTESWLNKVPVGKATAGVGDKGAGISADADGFGVYPKESKAGAPEPQLARIASRQMLMGVLVSIPVALVSSVSAWGTPLTLTTT